MKITCFARPPKFLNRMIMMLIGVFVQGVGLSLQICLGGSGEKSFPLDSSTARLPAGWFFYPLF